MSSNAKMLSVQCGFEYQQRMGNITETNVTSVLNQQKKLDSWFVSRVHLNVYRGCSHNCAYCDGRYEGYFAPERFATDIEAKRNAPERLDAALNPARKRRPLNSGYVLLGGGVSDSYQEVEEELELTRKCLGVILKWRQPVHLLTKSTLVTRDLPVIAQIHAQKGALVSFSFSTTDEAKAKVFEPGCSLPAERLAAMSRLRAEGIPTGAFLMPVLPGVSDSAEALDRTVGDIAAAGAQFVLFGGLTLKEGRQKEHYLRVLERFDGTLLEGTKKIFSPNRWGAALPAYYQRIEERFNRAAISRCLPRRIPPEFFWPVCRTEDALQVTLLQLEYLQRAHGGRFPFGRLAGQVRGQSQLVLEPGSPAQNPNHAVLLEELVRTRGKEYFAKFR